MNYKDNLILVNSKQICPACKLEKEAKKHCTTCHSYGFLPIDISGLWNNSNAFLVCGGPSLNTINYNRLSERGVISLGINNVAAYVPVNAWVFSDPQEKFHHGLYMDPKIITFSPIPKLDKRIRIKRDNEFVWDNPVYTFPNTYGFNRKTELYPDKFLTENYAMWGYGGNQEPKPFICLATMLLGIRLLCYLGVKRIYLLGVDFNRTETNQYAFNQNANPSNSRYIHENELLKSIYPSLQNNNIEILNCNPVSKCNVFDSVDFEDALIDCKNGIQEPLDLSGWYEKVDKPEKKG